MQLDIFDMQRYKNDNIDEGIAYPYILVLIDVFSRFAYVLPLQDKTQQIILDKFKRLVYKVMAEQKPNSIKRNSKKLFNPSNII